ncbi:bola-like protein [Jaminaea rosea]|uniref:Bola-like protein n=1 Tax=Jaminaea rosea TaxID=1569628 RepID=A0A316UZE2_9BASI|nr:bola-like protein [Jaminaea rosea]PWN30592.1 bola-like protein [Jaminaea rosea]
MTSGEQDIHALLTKRFKPAHLQVQDVSGGCGSFYAIVVASKEFAGLNTVKQHRMVNECLKDIIGGIHGLQVSAGATEEKRSSERIAS